jgi:hypothetical protein
MKTPLMISRNPTFPDLKTTALITDADGLLPVPRLDPEEDIRLRAETMTSTLKGIIDFRPPRHWGINE